MKKIISCLLILLLIFGCKAKKEDFYNLTFENTTIAVGYDNTDVINDNLHINDFDYYVDKKENEILNYIEIYVNDLDNKDIYIDDYKLGESITSTCSDLNGELVSNNGNACVLHKKVKDKENIAIFYGDILNDNIDLIDRIEISYID